MSKIRPILAGALVVGAAFMGMNGIALATTGQALILGHTNSADAVTTINRSTHGPALQLDAKPGSAPLAVNRSVRVAHLNADLVDGKNAKDLQTRAIRYELPALASGTNRVLVNLPNLPHGIYLASYSIVTTVDTSGNAVGCFFTNNGDNGDIQVLSYGTPSLFGPYVSTSSAGTLDVRHGTIQLVCFSQQSGNFNFYEDTNNHNEATVTLVRIDGLSVRTNAAPAAAASRHHADTGPAR